MDLQKGTTHEIREGVTIDLNFSYSNRTVETKGYVKAVSNDTITVELDMPDKNMTLPAGTDVYVLKKGILFNITDSKNFPVVQAVKVSKRNHARVDDVLKINYGHISNGDYNKYMKNPHIIFEQAFGETYKLPEIEDVTLKTIYELLYLMNKKIDHILDVVDKESSKQYSSPAYENVNISASGIRFSAYKKYQVGDMLALRIVLPLTMDTPVNVLGRIVAVADSEVKDRHTVSVKFIDLSRDDEETITRYVFKRQRALLRG